MLERIYNVKKKRVRNVAKKLKQQRKTKQKTIKSLLKRKTIYKNKLLQSNEFRFY